MQCEHCGKTIRAPHEMAGKQGKCPGCGNMVYIPTPEDEIEELPLAPVDDQDLRREQELLAERRRLDGLLAREQKAPPEPGPSRKTEGSGANAGHEVRPSGPAPSPQAGSTGGTRIEKAVIAFLVAMRKSDLDAAERAMNVIHLQPRTARDYIDRLAADQIPPPEMSGVPAGVYQGFLKNLRSRL